MVSYFTKDFGGSFGLNGVDYWKCKVCGLVVSKTHFDMSLKEWEELNVRYHSSFHGTDECEDDPRWIERLTAQSIAISELKRIGILPPYLDDFPWMDYACGDGKLVDMLGDKGLQALKFDRYMNTQNGQYINNEQLKEKKYGVVLNTSFFEHVRNIEPLDEIAGMVAENGVLAVHTMVRESIPNDPTWFYLLPVHCVFYTNKSMQILFDRWKFKASIYHVESRMWFWFKRDVERVREIIEREKNELSGEYHFKKGFVDYWK
jgi:hypothetical protein